MLKRIPLDLIQRNPDQPRQTFDEDALWDLAESIRQNGLQQPITVRPVDGPIPYQIVMGERRWRAHKLLQGEGEIDDILAHVRRMDDETMHVNAILENLQRADVSPIEEAKAYQRAIDEFGFTPETLAKRLGIGQTWRIAYRLRLLGLTGDNRDLLAKGVITATQAYYMAALSPNGQQKFLSLAKQGLVQTCAEADTAAAAIQAAEDQSGMDLGAPPRRVSAKPVEDRIDALGRALAPLFKDGEAQVPDGIMLVDAEKCLGKLKLLKRHIGQVETALKTSAALSQVA